MSDVDADAELPPAAVIAAEVRAGERSALELTEACLARAEAVGGPLNAFRAVTGGAARAGAAAIDERVARGQDPGPLAGVPVAIKDNIAVAGVPMTAGSSFLSGHVPDADAPVAAALAAAGAVSLGKLSMAEWAVGGTSQNDHYGDARNPWDPDRVPGGSSGGSGIVTAAGIAVAALGSDTGGSVRMPASLCGVSGLRPTYGRVSNRGSVPCAWSFDTIGPLARRVEDVAAVFDVIAGYDPDDPASLDVPLAPAVPGLARGAGGLRVGVLGGSFRAPPLALAAGAALDAAAEVLARAGAEVASAELPGHPEMAALTGDMLLADAAAFHAERLTRQPQGFGPRILARLKRGAAVSGPRYAQARQAQRAWRRRVGELLRAHDALLCPACPGPAPLIVESDPIDTTVELAWFSSVWSLAGVPALVLPAGFEAGLPLGLQLVGRPWEEATLLRLGHAYQQATDWHLRLPPAP